MSSGLQYFRCCMSALIPDMTVPFLDKVSHRVGDRECLVNVLYFHEKLAGGTRTFVWFGGSLRLEVSLHLFGVLGRSGLSVVGRHLETGEVCLHLVSGFMQVEPTAMNACGSAATRKWGTSDRL